MVNQMIVCRIQRGTRACRNNPQNCKVGWVSKSPETGARPASFTKEIHHGSAPRSDGTGPQTQRRQLSNTTSTPTPVPEALAEPASPLAPARDRIAALDTLRGVAVLGILLINILSFGSKPSARNRGSITSKSSRTGKSIRSGREAMGWVQENGELSVNSFRAEFVEKYQVPGCDSN
jgi:hypothetical protein